MQYMEKSPKRKIFLENCFSSKNEIRTLSFGPFRTKGENAQQLRTYGRYGVFGEVFLFSLVGSGIGQGLFERFFHLENAHRAEKCRFVLGEYGSDARNRGCGDGKGIGERRENGFFRSFVEGRDDIEGSMSIKKIDFFILQNVVYMYPTLELELYECGSYAVIGRVFSPDKDEIGGIFILFYQEPVCFQESRYVPVLLEISDKEHIFSFNAFM